MKKKLGIAAGIMCTATLTCNFIMPHIILAVDKQKKVLEKYAYKESFFTKYEAVREHFWDSVQQMEEKGYKLQSESYAIDEAEGLYIDSVYVPSTESTQNLIVLTTGVHGIEGYIGSVMLDVFWNEVYPNLNQKNCDHWWSAACLFHYSFHNTGDAITYKYGHQINEMF